MMQCVHVVSYGCHTCHAVKKEYELQKTVGVSSQCLLFALNQKSCPRFSQWYLAPRCLVDTANKTSTVTCPRLLHTRLDRIGSDFINFVQGW